MSASSSRSPLSLRSSRAIKRRIAHKRSRRLKVQRLEERSLLATLVWVGDASVNWNDNLSGNTNWDRVDVAQTNVLPAPGDTLIFSAVGANRANVNNTGAGTNYILQFTDSGYSISGDRIALGAGTALSDSVGGNTVALPLTLGAATEISVTAG